MTEHLLSVHPYVGCSEIDSVQAGLQEQEQEETVEESLSS